MEVQDGNLLLRTSVLFQLQAAACNLALVLRHCWGREPREACKTASRLFLLVLWITAARMAHPEAPTTLSWRDGRIHGLLSTAAYEEEDCVDQDATAHRGPNE